MQKLIYSAEMLESLSKEVLFEKGYPGTPFTLKGVRYADDKPGCWTTNVLCIYRGDQLLGAYRRLYPSYAAATFAPFEWKGQWYALYSADYTCTRVLRLNEDSIEDWCGEEPSSGGFCPVEFFLPQSFAYSHEGHEFVTFYEKTTFPTYQEFLDDMAEMEEKITYRGFGFLSGCHWGDDSSWKLRYVDYSKVDQKELKIDERFGYHDLPNRSLAECINLSCWEPEFPIIRADKMEQFCIRD